MLIVIIQKQALEFLALLVLTILSLQSFSAFEESWVSSPERNIIKTNISCHYLRELQQTLPL